MHGTFLVGGQLNEIGYGYSNSSLDFMAFQGAWQAHPCIPIATVKSATNCWMKHGYFLPEKETTFKI